MSKDFRENEHEKEKIRKHFMEKFKKLPREELYRIEHAIFISEDRDFQHWIKSQNEARDHSSGPEFFWNVGLLHSTVLNEIQRIRELYKKGIGIDSGPIPTPTPMPFERPAEARKASADQKEIKSDIKEEQENESHKSDPFAELDKEAEAKRSALQELPPLHRPAEAFDALAQSQRGAAEFERDKERNDYLDKLKKDSNTLSEAQLKKLEEDFKKIMREHVEYGREKEMRDAKRKVALALEVREKSGTQIIKGRDKNEIYYINLEPLKSEFLKKRDEAIKAIQALNHQFKLKQERNTEDKHHEKKEKDQKKAAGFPARELYRQTSMKKAEKENLLELFKQKLIDSNSFLSSGRHNPAITITLVQSQTGDEIRIQTEKPRTQQCVNEFLQSLGIRNPNWEKPGVSPKVTKVDVVEPAGVMTCNIDIEDLRTEQAQKILSGRSPRP